MKKGNIVKGKVIDINFGDRGIASFTAEDGNEYKVAISGALIGSENEILITKKKHDRYEGRVINKLVKSEDEIESLCPHFPTCGGCTYQNLKYEKELEMKYNQVKNIMLWNRVDIPEEKWEGIQASPDEYAYRNKMEFSFGNEVKDGPITLGMHKKGSMHDIVPVTSCNIVDTDFTDILKYTLNYAKDKNLSFYHKMSHEGFLRHLVIRKGINTNDILVNIVTTSTKEDDLTDFLEGLKNLKLKGTLKTVMHTVNDKVSDIVVAESTKLLYGEEFITDELLGLKFKISPFSFFQTNTHGAEKLYSIVREYVGDAKGKTVFDLYCGTGTIGMIASKEASKVIGVEIIKEAVDMANENRKLNNIDNAEFIAGDVKEVIKNLDTNPDIIILDPPRDGIHKDAIKDVIDFNAKEIVYVSCNPKSLARDLVILTEAGYDIKKIRCMDMFPHTHHVETVCSLSKIK